MATTLVAASTASAIVIAITRRREPGPVYEHRVLSAPPLFAPPSSREPRPAMRAWHHDSVLPDPVLPDPVMPDPVPPHAVPHAVQHAVPHAVPHIVPKNGSNAAPPPVFMGGAMPRRSRRPGAPHMPRMPHKKRPLVRKHQPRTRGAASPTVGSRRRASPSPGSPVPIDPATYIGGTSDEDLAEDT